jgi:hemoglobin
MESMEEIVAREAGAEGLSTLVAAFYRRIRTDDLIGPMYPPADFEAAEERLRGFLLFRFLGDTTYLESRGHPRLRMRHVPFEIGEPERDRWLLLMEGAMDDTQFPAAAREVVMPFFGMVAESMRNR